MFNVGPMELVVLAIVGLVVLGPDRLPGLAQDGARLLRTLRELATGARTQLRDELGPEFTDIDLTGLNPRTAIQRTLFGDGVNMTELDASHAIRRTLFGDEQPIAADAGAADVSLSDAPAARPHDR